MSAAAPVRTRPQPRPRRESAPPRPTLRLVATRPLAVGRVPFAILVGAILAAGLVSLLMLHTLAAQDAFRLHDLQATSSTLTDTEQQLELALQREQSPAALAQRARALGLVPTGSISFVRMHRHGKVVGVVKPAPPPAPKVVASEPARHPKPAADARHHRAGTKPAEHRRADRPGRG